MTTELAKAKEQTRMLAATEHHAKDEVRYSFRWTNHFCVPFGWTHPVCTISYRWTNPFQHFIV
jgi:hypothetical protein